MELKNTAIPMSSKQSLTFKTHWHCVKSVCIRSFSGPHFPATVFSQNAGKYGPEKLRIRILFTQCELLYRFY